MKQLIFILFVLTNCMFAFARDGYQFISPKPNSEFNTRESSIIIREGHFIDLSSLNDDILQVNGSKSGRIAGKVILSSDQKTIIFQPYQKFAVNEKVTVYLDHGLKTRSGKNLPATRFSFKIAPFAETPNPYQYFSELRPDYRESAESMYKAPVDSLPANFPPMKINIYDSSAIGRGKIFMAVASDHPGIGYYLMILNNDGTPFFARELPHDYAYDFKVQPNGLMSYAQFIEHHSYTGGGNVIHKIMDNSFTVTDSVQMGNGYIAEAHDFQMLPNGHYLLFGYYLTQVDMSQYVENGHPAAYVSGGVIQELDADKNVIFQWRSWDYYDFSEYSWGRRTSGEYVSAFHLNTISLDFDNHILLGSPGQNWKINRQTGEIIWRLGGDENEFSFVGVDSSDGISYITGHTFYRIANGNVLNYDNGSRRGNSTSKVHEFKLDEENKIAEWVWSYVPDTTIAGWHRGSSQRLPNGNTVIGWGGSSGKYSPAFTEVTADGEKIYELFFDPPAIESYRAFRFPVPDGEPCAEVTISEVAPGNTYEFNEDEVAETGIKIKINDLQGSGYNELTVAKFNYAPLSPQFAGKAPVVLPRRIVFSDYAINSIDCDIRFDVAHWKIKNPANAVVYFRQYEDTGLFLPLATTYNHVTGEIVATTTSFGEFILAQPDLASIVYTPAPDQPADSGTVNQDLPVTLQWNPIGFVTEYSLQVARDFEFSDVIIDEEFLTDAFYTIDAVDENATYFWRVQAKNDAGTSDWSAPQMFTSTAPFVSITQPNGGEAWQRGLEYVIKWDENIAEEIILELYKGETLVDVIDTTAAPGAYKWEIDPNYMPGLDYSLKIKSAADDALFDFCDGEFSIIDTTTARVANDTAVPREYSLFQNYPNPFNAVTRIHYQIKAQNFVNLTLFDRLGREVVTLVNGVKPAGTHSVTFDASNLSSGLYFYRLKTAAYTQTRKMILLK